MYLISVTEKEITEGMLTCLDAHKHCLWFNREIQLIEKQEKSYVLSRYLDITGPEDVVKQAQELLHNLKCEKIPHVLPTHNIEKFETLWSEYGIDPDKNEFHREYINEFCTSFERRLKQMIEEGVKEAEQESYSDPVYDEIVQHVLFCQEKIKGFSGRDECFQKIKDLLLSRDKIPIVIHGESGIGKTSLMAMLAANCGEWFRKEPFVIFRFVGTTPESSTIKSLLLSILHQIGMAYNITPTYEENYDEKSIDTMDLQELSKTFKHVLSSQLKRLREPLIILIDSLDQLHPDGNPQRLDWLPESLGRKVKLILSTLPDGDERQYGYLTKLESVYKEDVETNFIEVLGVKNEEAEQIFSKWLCDAKRSLTPQQMEILINTYRNSQTPTTLFLKLCFEEAALWTSFRKIENCVLQSTVKDAILLLFDRVERTHGFIFTCHTLAYITASRNGLSDAELEDILACDEQVLDDVFQFWTPPIRRLPPLLLVRLKADLSQYMVDRGSEGVKVSYWYHRQFIDTAHGKYLTNQGTEFTTKVHRAIADFFIGTWADQEKPYEDKEGKVIYKNRLVGHQPLKFKDIYNVRKLMELPHHLINGKMVQELEEQVLYNLDWLIAKLTATSYYEVVRDFQRTLDEISQGIDAESLSLMLKIIRLSQVSLQYDPQQLPAQFLARCQQGLDKFRQQCLNPKTLALLPMQVCLKSANSDLIFQLSDHQSDVVSIDISQDGKHGVSICEDYTLKTWDLERGVLISNLTEIISKKDMSIGKVHFCCHDTRILIQIQKNISSNVLKFFETKTLTEIFSPSNIKIWQHALFLENKAKSKAAILYDYKVSVVDLENFQVILEPVEDKDVKRLMKKYGEKAGDRSIMSAGKNVVAFTNGESRWMYLFDVTTQKFQSIEVFNKVQDSDDDQYTVDAIAVPSQDQWVIASSFMTSDLLFFDPITGEKIRTIAGNEKDIPEDYMLFNDDKLLIFPNSSNVCFWNLETEEREYKLNCNSVLKVAMSQDTNRLITCSNLIQVWEVDNQSNNKQDSNIDNSIGYIVEIIPFPQNTRYVLLTTTDDNTGKSKTLAGLLVYDMAKEEIVHHLHVSVKIEKLHLLDEQRVVFVVERQLIVLDLLTGEILVTSQGQLANHPQIKVLPTKNEVVTFTKSYQNLKVISMASGKTTHILCPEHTHTKKLSLNNLVVNSTGTIVVTADERDSKNEIFVFDLIHYTFLHRLSLQNQHDSILDVYESYVTSCGKYLINPYYGIIREKQENDENWDESNNSYTAILIWDLEKGKLLHHLEDREAMTKIINATQQGSDLEIPQSDHYCSQLIESGSGDPILVLQGSEDGVLRIFDLESGELVKKINNTHKLELDKFISGFHNSNHKLPYLYSWGYSEKSLWCYETDTWQPLASFTFETTQMRSKVLLGHGDVIVAADDGQFLMWQLRGQKVQHQTDFSTMPVYPQYQGNDSTSVIEVDLSKRALPEEDLDLDQEDDRAESIQSEHSDIETWDEEDELDDEDDWNDEDSLDDFSN